MTIIKSYNNYKLYFISANKQYTYPRICAYCYNHAQYLGNISFNAVLNASQICDYRYNIYGVKYI